MPHRLIPLARSLFDHLAAGAEGVSIFVAASVLWFVSPEFFGWGGLVIGAVFDWWWRARVYASLPRDERKPLGRELHNRAFYSALAFFIGGAGLIGVKRYYDLTFPEMAEALVPITAVVCVVVAIPVVEMMRAIAKGLSGRSGTLADAIVDLIARIFGGGRGGRS